MAEKPLKKGKRRLDQLLVEKGLVGSREKARRLIMEGKVLVNEEKVFKPGTFVNSDLPLRLLRLPRFVSRGGEKLDYAIDHFGIRVENKVCLDAGSSTGGFVDCLLQRGARLVIAVDVGYGQLAWKLRQDNRVFLIERQNIRYLKPEQVPEPPDLVTADLSFISLKKVFSSLKEVSKNSTHYLFLIKPQFEAGREKVGRKGVVRDPAVQEEVLLELGSFFLKRGYSVSFTYSPVRGAEGNIEFFAYLLPGYKTLDFEEIKRIVAIAQREVR